MEYIDLGLLIILVISTLAGYKAGVIKSSVRILALLISAFIAYMFKGYAAEFLIDLMPFVDFGGIFEGITSMNILFYHGVSFLVIFIILYSILNIFIIFAGFLDKILKMTIILYLPDKILGAIIGFVQGTMISFIIIFVLAQVPYTQEYVINSTYGYQILNRTPIIRTVLADCTVISGEIADIIVNVDTTDEDYVADTQVSIMNIFIKYGLISSETAQELIDDEKVYLPGVLFG